MIGKWTRKLLEQRRSPLKPDAMICQVCSATRKAQGLPGFVRLQKARLYLHGIVRPGVMCPQCGLCWVEQEDQPVPPERG